MFKKLVIFVFYAAYLVSSQVNGAPIKLDNIAAVVNQDVITSYELEYQVKTIMQQLNDGFTKIPPKNLLLPQVLDYMILNKLQQQKAAQLGIEVDDLQVNETIKELANKDNKTLAAYREELAQKKIDYQDFRNSVRTELLNSKLQHQMLEHSISVSEAEIDGFLNSLAGQSVTGTSYNLGHILILPKEDTKESINQAKIKANNIIKEIKSGKISFTAAAASYSKGQQALNGGSLGWRTLEEIPNIFIEHIANLNIGDVVGPITTTNSSHYHILTLIDKKIGANSIPQEYKVKHLLIKNSNQNNDAQIKSELLKIRADILENKITFANAAKTKSQESYSAEEGGDLGWVKQDDLLPKIYNVVSTLELNKISEPIKTELGWHLVQVLDKRSKVNSIIAARNQAADAIHKRKFFELQTTWLKELRDSANIVIKI